MRHLYFTTVTRTRIADEKPTTNDYAASYS